MLLGEPQKPPFKETTFKEAIAYIWTSHLPEEGEEALPGHGPVLPPLGVHQLGDPPTGGAPTHLSTS